MSVKLAAYTNWRHFRLMKNGISCCSQIQITTARSYCDDNTSDNQQKKGAKKLEALLESLKVESTNFESSASAFNLDLAMPKKRRNEKKKATPKSYAQEQNDGLKIENPLIEAAKEVAASFKDEDTEIDLINKLKSEKFETQEAKTRGMQLLDLIADMNIEGQMQGRNVTEKPLKTQPSSRNDSSSSDSDEAPVTQQNVQTSATKVDLTDMFVGMKIDRTKKEKPQNVVASRTTRRDYDDSERKGGYFRAVPVQSRLGQRVSLSGDKPLNIFSQSECEEMTTTWAKLSNRELNLAVSHPPKNPFEEMIKWTEQGKLWKFPIDNEYGLTDEINVGFHEHIFLQTELEDGFPNNKAVLVFMELVCHGLSKNPYISIQRKREHIQWYRNYFKDKEAILKAVEAKAENN